MRRSITDICTLAYIHLIAVTRLLLNRDDAQYFRQKSSGIAL